MIFDFLVVLLPTCSYTHAYDCSLSLSLTYPLSLSLSLSHLPTHAPMPQHGPLCVAHMELAAKFGGCTGTLGTDRGSSSGWQELRDVHTNRYFFSNDPEVGDAHMSTCAHEHAHTHTHVCLCSLKLTHT